MAAQLKLADIAPARSAYFPAQPAPLESLPFVCRQGDSWHYWRVTPTDDYFLDNALGYEYAAHYLQWLRGNPRCGSGVLAQILLAMRHRPNAPDKGIIIGFISFLEDQLQERATQVDPYIAADALYALLEANHE